MLKEKNKIIGDLDSQIEDLEYLIKKITRENEIKKLQIQKKELLLQKKQWEKS